MRNIPFEPYKIKMVEPIHLTDRRYRENALEKAHYNPFALLARDVTIDLLTDSGTSAMSDTQWSALMRGDESYAGSESFLRFEQAVREVTGFPIVIPTHQGRSAENLFFSAIIKPGDIVPNNTHFDTTEANVVHKNGRPVNLPVMVASDLGSIDRFKGNMDTEALLRVLSENPGKVPVVIMTVTNNSAGGQPVSMENIRQTSTICDKFNIPLYFDCARFSENCYFIKKHEPGYENKTVKEIAREMFSFGQGALMSAKKDALVNIGGFFATHDDKLADRVKEIMVVIEGFVTYGGLSGRDMETVATGLLEGLDEDYLESYIGQVEYLGNQLKRRGVPILNPTGGHAVYLDARGFLPHLHQSKLPAWSLSCEGYLAGGVRSVEIGSVMFACEDPTSGDMLYPKLELVRLAIPRRVYTYRHMDYVADVFGNLYDRKNEIGGMNYTYCPKRLRHFLARFEPI